MRARHATVLLPLLLCVSCFRSGYVNVTAADGAVLDIGPQDAGAMDAVVTSDGASLPDATAVEAAPTFDATVGLDTWLPADAGFALDASSGLDNTLLRADVVPGPDGATLIDAHVSWDVTPAPDAELILPAQPDWAVHHHVLDAIPAGFRTPRVTTTSRGAALLMNITTALSIESQLIALSGAMDGLLLGYDILGVAGPATRISGGVADKVQDLWRGNDGSSYVTGQCQDLMLGGNLRCTAGDYDIFVARIDDTGNITGGFSAGSAVAENASVLARSPAGDFCLAGEIMNDIDLGGGSIPLIGTRSLWIAGFDASGNHVWSTPLGGDMFDTVSGVAMDIQGNCYIVGTVQGELSFNGQTVLPLGGDSVLASWEPDGTPRWIRRGVNWSSNLRGLVIDSADRIYVAGTGGLGGGGQINHFVTRLTTQGAEEWSVDLGDGMFVTDMSLGPGGHIYAVGGLEGTVTLPNMVLANATATRQIGLLIFTPEGRAVGAWTSTAADASLAASSVAVASDGAVYVAGLMDGTADLGSGPMVSTSPLEHFLVRLRP